MRDAMEIARKSGVLDRAKDINPISLIFENSHCIASPINGVGNRELGKIYLKQALEEFSEIRG